MKPLTTVKMMIFMVIPLSVIVMYYYGLRPALEARDTSRERLVLMQRELVKLDTALQQGNRIRKVNAELERKYTYLSKRLGGPETNSLFFTDIGNALANNSLQVIRMAPQTAASKENYTELPVNLTLRGRFESLIGFLCEMKYSQYLNRIESLSIRRTDQDTLLADLTVYFSY